METPVQTTPRWLMASAVVGSTVGALLLVMILAGLAPTNPSALRIVALAGVWLASAVALFWIGGRMGRIVTTAQVAAILGAGAFAA